MHIRPSRSRMVLLEASSEKTKLGLAAVQLFFFFDQWILQTGCRFECATCVYTASTQTHICPKYRGSVVLWVTACFYNYLWGTALVFCFLRVCGSLSARLEAKKKKDKRCQSQTFSSQAYYMSFDRLISSGVVVVICPTAKSLYRGFSCG